MVLAFGFGNLAMLGWLAAAAAPLIIHLWNRRRYREVPWAAVEFLLAAMRKNARRIRLQQWLLLAVRTLLIVLVVLAIAEPFWDNLPAATGGSGPVHRVLVLDSSFSMAYQSERETCFDRARQLAGELVESSQIGDEFSLILIGQPSTSVFGRPILDKTSVAGEIARLEVSHGTGNLASALTLVAESIDQADTPDAGFVGHEVYFFTDLGQNTWRAAGGEQSEPASREPLESLAESATLRLVDVGHPAAANLAVTRLEAASPITTLDTEVQFQGTVTNFSDQPRERVEVELVVDGAVAATRSVAVAGRGEAAVGFSHRFRSPGEQRVAMRIGGDRLEVDNTRWLAMPIEEQLSVLCVAGKQGAAEYVAAALDPEDAQLAGQSAIRPLIVSDGELLDLQLSNYKCVFLCNVARLTGDEAAMLRRYVVEGGGLVVFLGDQVDAAEYNRLLAAQGSDESLLPARLGGVVSGASYGIDPLDYRHPIVAPFRGRERAGLLTTPVDRYFQLEIPPDRTESELVVALADGDPLIVASPLGRGRTLLVATAGSMASTDAATGQPWTTMPAWPSFLPIVREMLQYALAGSDQPSQALVGTTLTSPVPTDTPVAEVAITRPDGRTDTERVADTVDGPAWSYDDTDRSGIYVARSGPPSTAEATSTPGRAETLFAVNVDPAESDLSRIGTGDLPQQIAVLADGEQVQRDSSTDMPRRGGIHRWMLLGALLLALWEVQLAWWFGRGAR